MGKTTISVSGYNRRIGNKNNTMKFIRVKSYKRNKIGARLHEMMQNLANNWNLQRIRDTKCE